MALERGDTVWIPCEVTQRVFPDERNVRIDLPDGHWDGVVDVRQLREDVLHGRTAICATVVETSTRELKARLPGQTTRRQFIDIPV